MRTIHRSTAAVLLLTVLSACTDSAGPVEPAPRETQRIEFSDDEGHGHLLERAWSGHRLATERHYIDGELFSINTTTYKMDGTVESNRLMVLSGGRVVEVIDLGTLSVDGNVASSLDGFADPSYPAATIRCATSITILATSSGILAGTIFTRNPLAILGAAEAYIKAINNLRKCYRGNGD